MNCDPLARWYRWLEYAGMGRALERRRAEFLPQMASARRILILGEGDGRFLAALLRVNGQAEIDIVDNSARMLATAQRRAGPGRVRFHHADARSWKPPTGLRYDLIVTHFFLDCFSNEDLEALIPRMAAAGAETCDWIVSEFRQPARGWAAWRARLWIGALYRLFGWITGLEVRRLPEYAVVLAKSGFQRAETVIAEAGLLTSERWARRPTFAIDAPPDAPLHSHSPKSSEQAPRRTAYVGMTHPAARQARRFWRRLFYYGRPTRLRSRYAPLDSQVPHGPDPLAFDLPERPGPG